MPHDAQIRQAPERDYLAIKAAFRKLLKIVGGTREAAGKTRGSESRLSEAGAPDKMDRFAAIDQVYDLEIECGQPIVTAALADMHGFDLVRRDAARPIGIHAHFARIVTESRDVECEMATAMADGTISEAEKQQILNEIGQAVTALQNAAAELRGKTLRAVG